MDIFVKNAHLNNLKNIDVSFSREKMTVVTGVSGSGKSSLVFDTVLVEAQRRFFHTLSNYTRQFLDLGSRPAVDRVSGLSPTISISQNETPPSRKATVGSTSELSELLGVLLARFGTKFCPTHQLSCEATTPSEHIVRLLDRFSNKNLIVTVSVAEQNKGNFAKVLEGFAKKGFLRAYIDGHILPLSTIPELKRDSKHTIKVIVDIITVDHSAEPRLLKSLLKALELGDGQAECFQSQVKGQLDFSSRVVVSTKSGCPECGFSYPKLDSRYFNSNSLGKCTECMGYGSNESDEFASDGDEEYADGLQNEVVECEKCYGTGVRREMESVRIGPDSIHDFLSVSLDKILPKLESLRLSPELEANPAMLRVVSELTGKMNRLLQMGLSYLQLRRRVVSLSGGEMQRLRLAGILGESLTGVLYILDEPSQGLHGSEVSLVAKSLRELCDQGNTVIAVDHDETMMRFADEILDLGPGGGAQGGSVVAVFAPKDSKKHSGHSFTAAGLSEQVSELDLIFTGKPVEKKDQFIEILDARCFNVDLRKVKLRRGSLNVISGVSGAGKSTLAGKILYEGLARGFRQDADFSNLPHCSKMNGVDDLEKIEWIDRRPLGKNSRSMPATYLDAFSELRTLFSKLPDAQVSGLDPASFSLSRAGGRCENCEGRGDTLVSMKFLSDQRVKCQVCYGQRYAPHVLEVRYQNLSIADVLNLSIAEAAETFKNHRKLVKALNVAVELGLGYLKLGQSMVSLSGGEAQRLKLAPYFGKTFSNTSLLILEEPTMGLHFKDVENLLNVLKKLTNQGVTLVLIEHNFDVLKAADWLVELGPGAADRGGKLVYEGHPSGILKTKASATKRWFESGSVVKE